VNVFFHHIICLRMLTVYYLWKRNECFVFHVIFFQSLQDWLSNRSQSGSTDIQHSPSFDETGSTTDRQFVGCKPNSCGSNYKPANNATASEVVSSTSKISNGCKRKPVSSVPTKNQSSVIQQSSHNTHGQSSSCSVGNINKKCRPAEVVPSQIQRQCIPKTLKSETVNCKASASESGSSRTPGRDCQDSKCLSAKEPQSASSSSQNASQKRQRADVAHSPYDENSGGLPSKSVVPASQMVGSSAAQLKKQASNSVTTTCAKSVSNTMASCTGSSQARTVKPTVKTDTRLHHTNANQGPPSSQSAEVRFYDC
jgi:hypothetical protein